jgi:Tfp pilus assembly protein PilF
MENTRVSHYEIVRLLGRGGMGEVYEAVDVDLGRRVALKFIAPELAAEPEAFRRFEREARLAAALNHPHIATLYAFERDAGRPFIAMELMSGKSLRARISAGPMPPAEALRIARDVASALAHAHNREIIHRDIKPENLMFDLEGVAKVTDFGLARAMQASRLTMTGASLGTAAYMAPESVRGESGKPADIFALGIMLHEMLAGGLPFKGDNPLALLYCIANNEPVPLRAVRPDVSEAAEALVLRMLVKDPAARVDAATVARELAALSGAALTEAELRGLEAPSSGMAPARTSGTSIGTQVTEELEVEPRGNVALAPVQDAALAPVSPARPSWLRGGRVRLLISLVLLLGAGAFALWYASMRTATVVPEAELLNGRGLEAMRHDSLDAARGYFEAALRKDPRNSATLINLGSIAVREGDDTRAAVRFNQALGGRSASPGHRAAALYNLADINMRAGAWASAVSELRQSIALDNASGNAYNNLGYALVMGGQLNEARAELDSAIARFPGFGSLHKNAGMAAYRLGDNAGALQALDRAIQLDPALSAAYALRARVRADGNDKAGARADWGAYLELAPDSTERAELESALRRKGVPPPS